jgi:ribosome-binding factor A
MTPPRMRRVNEAMREVLSSLIALGLKDPRIGFVTVTAVETSSDLTTARVFVSVLGEPADQEQALEGLRSSRGLLQAHVAQQLRMKRTPTLTFIHDTTPERGMRLERLIADVAPDDNKDENEGMRP